MQYWKAHYKDMLHDTAIEIINTEEDYNTEPLSFTLDNITFCGTSLSDFHLKDKTQYVEACKKFSLLKWGGHNSKFTSPYGSDDYGLMLCFCRHKNDCLTSLSLKGKIMMDDRKHIYVGTTACETKQAAIVALRSFIGPGI